MARDTELITTAEIKTRAIPNASLDVAYLDQYILVAQRHYIREFLSKEFYEELQTQVAASTLTANNTNVLVYIKDALAHYVVYESLPQLRHQIAKGGVFNNLNATSEPSSDGGYGAIRNDYMAKGEKFREEIDYYIKQIREDDATAYPLYCKKAKQTGGIIFYD
jgi:hypothetical protein